ncbi:DinB family protein [Flagellimonas algicola]|uniref:DinB family protein n=1 Tax=Flagellimonas algicola TaxID=2583815 RepID=UPI001386A8CF|nr:DinB family protein [Allomuricauda algicola]
MNSQEIISALENNAGVFRETLSGLPSQMLLWKAKPSDWPILGIICHLVDEEREDFRARVKHALETPTKPLVPIDPEGWFTQRNYLNQDFQEMLLHFLNERAMSIKWLRGLENVNWESSLDHPDLGKISAHSFLLNWLAHDYHHIRQINNLKHAYLRQTSGDSLTYAGKW